MSWILQTTWPNPCLSAAAPRSFHRYSANPVQASSVGILVFSSGFWNVSVCEGRFRSPTARIHSPASHGAWCLQLHLAASWHGDSLVRGLGLESLVPGDGISSPPKETGSSPAVTHSCVSFISPREDSFHEKQRGRASPLRLPWVKGDDASYGEKRNGGAGLRSCWLTSSKRFTNWGAGDVTRASLACVLLCTLKG